MFSKFLKVALVRSYSMNEVYNSGFAPEPNVSMLNEIVSLVPKVMYLKLRNEKQN